MIFISNGLNGSFWPNVICFLNLIAENTMNMLNRLLTFFMSMLKYLLSAETKQNNPIYERQAFSASILRLLHQVYEKILNYMNKNVLSTIEMGV